MTNVAYPLSTICAELYVGWEEWDGTVHVFELYGRQCCE